MKIKTKIKWKSTQETAFYFKMKMCLRQFVNNLNVYQIDWSVLPMLVWYGCIVKWKKVHFLQSRWKKNSECSRSNFFFCLWINATLDKWSTQPETIPIANWDWCRSGTGLIVCIWNVYRCVQTNSSVLKSEEFP